MSDVIEIPKISYDEPGPGWIPVTWESKPDKPVIKCKCGAVCGIGLHHVHADGTVTRSFFHSTEAKFVENGVEYHHTPGCGWHVWLKLKDYDQGDFPPVP